MSKFQKYLSEAKKRRYDFYTVWYDKDGKRLGEDEESAEVENPQAECERRVALETRDGNPEKNIYVTVQCQDADAIATNRIED